MKRENDKCPQCGGTNTVCFIVLSVTIPSRYNRQLTKTDLRSKEVRITGQMHEFTEYYCNDCRSVYKMMSLRP